MFIVGSHWESGLDQTSDEMKGKGYQGWKTSAVIVPKYCRLWLYIEGCKCIIGSCLSALALIRYRLPVVVWTIMSSLLLRSLTLFLLMLTAVADSSGIYYIDDTDPSITWTGSFVHLNETFEPIAWADASKCYNKTFTVGQGTTNQHFGFRLPFTGEHIHNKQNFKASLTTSGNGVTLYVAYNNRLGLNVSVTLDNNFTTLDWFIMDTDYATPTFTSYNATLYDKQNLTYGSHVLNVVLQDYRLNQSDLMFDYAAVTGVRPVLSDNHSSKKIGAGIGGGLGALAIVVAIVLIILFSRRRARRKPSPMELNLIDPDTKDPSTFNRMSTNMTATFRPSHNRRHSSFSQSSASPISPVKPIYSKFLGQKHPFHELRS
ncbi:hypothetical protein PILCRDRAFT_530598 [Piloderma croceum F 1598]|uniref:Uncharacterized protein n=1 Tax=Piloderma croceum (strain F 1598) TaxID=765440 RepID=A0A0C3F6P4_PILCF|nr:hypothetical protein PILCRDRAFT_530598 [Piloderma croceum F 1598]